MKTVKSSQFKSSEARKTSVKQMLLYYHGHFAIISLESFKIKMSDFFSVNKAETSITLECSNAVNSFACVN